MTGFTSTVLTIEKEGSIATLWLDREEARNAMGPEFWSDLPLAMDVLGSDPEIRCIVIAAKGPHFSVGLDGRELARWRQWRREAKRCATQCNDLLDDPQNARFCLSS